MTGIVHVARDITERKREEEERRKLEQQLVQAQKMEAMGRLARGVAHDFNNLLGVITGYAELAEAKLLLQDPLRRHLDNILGASRKAAGLTRQLLAFSRKQILSPVVLDLNAVILETVKMLKRIIGEDVSIETSLAEPLWAIKADANQIVQVLMNLSRECPRCHAGRRQPDDHDAKHRDRGGRASETL